MHYITWVLLKYTGEKPIYLGESLTEDICGCLKIVRGHLSTKPSLRCEHEQADDRLTFHIDDAVRSCYKKATIV